MIDQDRLVELLKHKGIGPESSKSLKTSDLEELKVLFLSPDCSLITKATILTALLTLPATETEKAFIEKIYSSPEKHIPLELIPFIKKENTSNFQNIINEVIAHTNLSEQQAYTAIQHLFDNSPEHLKGAFLEAERLKRETFEENSGFLTFLISQINPHQVEIPFLIDLGDSYDGCLRFPSLNLFTAAILGSMGYPCIIHGVNSVAPKEGTTHHQILEKAGKKPLITIQEAIRKLSDPLISWTYLDQQMYHPELYHLKKVRKEMVKRPFLATFEKMLQPIQAQKNYLITQYTHAHYKTEIAKLVQAHCTFERALHVKGMEGTCMLNPKIPSACLLIEKDKTEEITLSGETHSFFTSLSRNDKSTAGDALELGITILNGIDIPERDFLIYNCASMISNLFNREMNICISEVQQAIDSGKAKLHWDAF